MTDIFIKVIEMSMTASIVIGVVMVMRLFLRKAPKVFSYVLWAAALFRLLCPISFQIPSAPIPSVEIPYSTDVNDRNADGLFITKNDVEIAPAPEYSEPQRSVSPQVTAVPEPVSEIPVKREINYIAIASYIWAFAVIIMAFRGIISWARLSHSLRSAQKMGGNVYVSPAIADPFIMGIIRPKIYLPTGLSCTESDLIIRHEKAHMHRGDHIAKLVMYGALCVHCFNPLVWLMFRLFERDMEMSCDERVTADMTKEQKADYSQTLLKISAKPTAAFTACFGESGTKQRIKNVLSFKKPAVWVVIVLAVAAVIVSVFLCADKEKTVILTGVTYECYHDDFYTEPILRNGNYCLKDSTLYLHIDEDNIQLCGSNTDLLNFSRSMYVGYESDMRVHLQEELLRFWETPQKYTVETIHGFIMKEISPTYEAVFIHVPADREQSLDLLKEFGCDLLYIDENTIRFSEYDFIYSDVRFDLREGTKVDIQSSEASENVETVTVPDVSKLNYRKAAEQLKNAGLRPAFVFIFSEEEQNTVIRNIPDKGEVTGKDTYVIVQISGGPETEENKTEYFMESALGKNGSFGYINTAQIMNIEEYYEHYRIEMTDEEELKKQYELFYPQFGENVYSYKFYKECVDIPIFDESCERIVDFFMISGVIYEPPEDDEYNDWTDTIKLIPLTEEHQRTVDISSASPDVLYSDSRNCLFSDGTGGVYLYNFENRELMLAVDFLASMELVNSGIAIEENRYGGASIGSSWTTLTDKPIYFSFETKGKEKRGGAFNGRSYHLDVINSKLSISGTSGTLYEAAVTKPIDPAEHPDAISSSLAMINKRDFVYMVNSGTDEGKLPMIRLARSINGNVEYFDPFEKTLIPQERKAPEEWGLSFTAEAVDKNRVKMRLSCTCDRELTTGSYFIIQKKEGYSWSEPKYCVDYYLNEHGWTDEAIIIPNDSERVITEDWSGLYGELDYGHYRIGKHFRMANGEEMMLFAYFNID